jgi:hypothetical protein
MCNFVAIMTGPGKLLTNALKYRDNSHLARDDTLMIRIEWGNNILTQMVSYYPLGSGWKPGCPDNL